MKTPLSDKIANMTVLNAEDIASVKEQVDFVFCAVNLSKDATREMEEAYAKAEIPVVSNNSACRGIEDVPMLMPEINSDHLAVIETQKKRLGTKRGFIAVKPNCSIQSYVPMLTPLLKFGLSKVVATTYQAISGAGKTFAEWPEMIDNVIPFIGGEEEKSEKEPLKIWGKVEDGEIKLANSPKFTAQCLRVPVSDGHMAAVFVSFKNKPSKEEILEAWSNQKTSYGEQEGVYTFVDNVVAFLQGNVALIKITFKHKFGFVIAVVINRVLSYVSDIPARFIGNKKSNILAVCNRGFCQITCNVHALCITAVAYFT
mgnify:CR=1 FL=1